MPSSPSAAIPSALLLRYSGVTPTRSASSRIGRRWCRAYGRSHPTIRTAACMRPASWSAFPAISALPMIPMIVFEAARLLRDDPDIHFLLSGWGIGFERLKAIAVRTPSLPNVTLVERVPRKSLEAFLAAADVWLIPYRKDVAGVSVPSRFYNLLAVGRPVILVSEPNAEAALTVSENDLGWVVEPGNPEELARTIRLAALRPRISRGPSARPSSRSNYNFAAAMAGYAGLDAKAVARAQ